MDKPTKPRDWPDNMNFPDPEDKGWIRTGEGNGDPIAELWAFVFVVGFFIAVFVAAAFLTH